VAFGRPRAWWESTKIPSHDWPYWLVGTPRPPTRSWWLFPPNTSEVQFDEKWSFVAKKQKNCDPTNPDDDHCGDYWDHVAFDPEHKLVLAVIPGARTGENSNAIVAKVSQQLGGKPPELMTSDEYAPYTTAIETTFSKPEPAPRERKPGRPRILPERRLRDDVTYATVHKHRENNHVVAIEQRLIFGAPERLEEVLGASTVSHRVNTSFVERHNATDRGRNARKVRKTYRFSKDWQVHEAMTYLTMYSYNFCWSVRTLRVRDEEQRWRERSPALAAGLTDHVWTWREWFRRPAAQSA
jgi:IS1 family transposase